MRPNEITAALETLIDTRRPSYIWGPPGVGKSSLVHALAKKRGLRVLDLRAVLLDPVDLRGLPTVTGSKRGEKVAEWCPPAFLPLKGRDNGGPGIIFADELAQAAPLVQASFMQGILDHRIGEAELDPAWVWVAASNRQEDRAGAHRLISPLLNRFIHLDLEVHGDDWNEWAIHQGIHHAVRSYLRFKPAHLHCFDANSSERAFPTPRSWEFVSGIIGKLPANLRLPVIGGCIGSGPASEFVAHMKLAEELPDMDEVLKSPKTHKMYKDASVLYALSGALVDRVRLAETQKTLDAAGEYVARMPLEFATLTVKDAGTANSKFYRAEPVLKWMHANKTDLL